MGTTKLLGNRKQGLLFVISAPAGTGKTTIARMLVREFPCVVESISCTTRSPRPGEVPGKDYHFLTQEEFQQKVEQGAFLEYADVHGYLYGTLREAVDQQREKGHHVLLVIDVQGGAQVRCLESAISIFLQPPSLVVLRERLFSRGTESPAAIEQRLEKARQEMEQAAYYDYVVINDNLDVAYQVVRSVIIAEEHRVI